MPKQSEQQDEKKPGRLAQKIAAVREKYPIVDRILRMQQHYNEVRGNHLAGAITYFGFLSIFPLLAIGFAVLAYVVGVYPEAQAKVTEFLQENLPGLLGKGGLDPAKIGENSTAQVTAGVVGGLGLLYSGLGFLDALREALRQMWSVAPADTNIVKRKAADLLVLVTLGLALVASLAITGLASGATGQVLDWVGLESNPLAKGLLIAIGVVLAVASNTLILIIVFMRLPGHRLPLKNVLTGAAFGGLLLEVLKQLGTTLVGRSSGNSALYGSFAITIGLLLYINFAARIVMYAASWSVVGPEDTLEESLAGKGESLSADEAAAATEARRRRGSDADIPLGERHETSAGKVPVTTSGVDDGKGRRRAGADAQTTGTDQHGGHATAKKSGRGGRVPGEHGTTGSDDRELPPRAASKGSIMSVAGVLALLAVRRKNRRPGG